MKSEIKNIHCKGRLPDHRLCEKLLYRTDGEYIYDLNGSIVNKGQGKQSFHCGQCETKSTWTRNSKFIRSSKFPTDKFQRKF